MSFLTSSRIPDQPPVRIQKRIQLVLEEQNLWPNTGLKLSCDRLKCSSCQAVSNCKLCIKGKQCESCIKLKMYNGKCDKSCICNECINRKDCCQYTQKKYCTSCKEQENKKSYFDCERMPPKYSSSSKNSHNLI